MIGEHKCKGHNYAHQYTACDECRHEYCDKHWRWCPRCCGTSNVNRWMAATAPDPTGLAKRKAAEPLKPAEPQDPCDVGLFSDDARQTDLVDMVEKSGWFNADVAKGFAKRIRR